jgi:GntR family transcriptional regulator, phosphonate transport system regulatory protein
MQPDLVALTPERLGSGPSTPRWEQIASALRDDLAKGRFAPGTRLPNEAQLAERFAVHRHTLRQAVRRLVHEGHLRVVQGRGTFVRALVLDYTLQRRTRLSENLADAGERAQRDLLAHEITAAGAWAASLRLPKQANVVLLHTRASARGRPIGLSSTAYPAARLPDMAAAFTATGSITAALRLYGVTDYQRASSTVSCRLPTADEADALARAATEPVLVVQFHSVDSDGVPVEAGRTVFAADAVQLTVRHDT